ncbi:hypothetical protein ACET3X_006399 [Alternaria dauci]|uniref:F-box domain-containing protein n=1 Tax=Alternaria dauci TaxID=48095 RepID=A0ABR3UDK2_9PLEO
MPVKRRAATPPIDAMSANKLKAKLKIQKLNTKKLKAKERGKQAGWNAANHDQEPRDDNGRLKHFPLLRLPAEIRNAIYEHVFSDTQCNLYNPSVEEDVVRALQSFNACNLGLLATCRQLYTETHLLPYKLAYFHFNFEIPYDEEWVGPVNTFAKPRTEEQRAAVGNNKEIVIYNHKEDESTVFYGLSS